MTFREVKNYKIKDDKAYMEDDILVHNLYAYNIPMKTTLEEARKYFSTFGKVRRLHFVVSKKPNRKTAPKVGFIYFADPIAATKTLRKKEHMLHETLFFVRACNTWEQPRSVNAAAKNAVAENAVAPNKRGKKFRANVLILNIDCLELICKKLPISDQLSFACTCHQFRSAFISCQEKTYRNYDLRQLKGMTLWQIYDIFRIMGQFIQTMHGRVPHRERVRVVEYIGKYCCNLKELTFIGNKIKTAEFGRMFRQTPKLTTLQLHNCAVSDNGVTTLKMLPELRVLMLTDNYKLTGKNLCELKNLQELCLYGCRSLEPQFIIDCCESLKFLRSLDIQRCMILSTNYDTDILQYCEALEVLKFSNLHFEHFELLPRLKQLEIFDTNPKGKMSLFSALARQKSCQLETLRIFARNAINYDHVIFIAQIKTLKQLECANNEHIDDACLDKLAALEHLELICLRGCKSITKDGLLILLDKCLKLHCLDIRYCKAIGNDFVVEAVATLQQKGSASRLLYAAYSGIKKDEIRDRHSKHLIKLTFGARPLMGVDKTKKYRSAF